MSEEAPPVAPCCFCGSADYQGRAPSALMLMASATSTWLCHEACFRERLPDMPDPWSFYEGDPGAYIPTSGEG